MRDWPVSYRIIEVDANSKLSGAAWGQDRKAERVEVAEPCRGEGGADRHTASRHVSGWRDTYVAETNQLSGLVSSQGKPSVESDYPPIVDALLLICHLELRTVSYWRGGS